MKVDTSKMKATKLNVKKPCYLVSDPEHQVKFIYQNKKSYIFESTINQEVYALPSDEIDKFVEALDKAL